MILLFGGNKCSGKSTTMANTAVYFSQFQKTVLVDTDNQQSITKWNKRREENNLIINYDLIKIHDDNVAKKILELNNNYDLVMVDVAGVNSSAFLQALGVADITIITLESSIKAMETLSELNIQRNSLLKINPNNIFAFLQVRTKNDFGLSKKRERFINYCHKFKFGKILKTIVYEKDSFSDSDFLGGTVFETKDITAQDNIIYLCKEIVDLDI